MKEEHKTSLKYNHDLGLNKIPCLFKYEQLFIYTTIWFKRNILLGLIIRYVNLAIRTCNIIPLGFFSIEFKAIVN